jgi:hypothetical protein
MHISQDKLHTSISGFLFTIILYVWISRFPELFNADTRIDTIIYGMTKERESVCMLTRILTG